MRSIPNGNKARKLFLISNQQFIGRNQYLYFSEQFKVWKKKIQIASLLIILIPDILILILALRAQLETYSSNQNLCQFFPHQKQEETLIWEVNDMKRKGESGKRPPSPSWRILYTPPTPR